MSIFVKREPCPGCRAEGWDRKGDNLGVWTDHKYCFSCGYYERISPIEALKQTRDREFHNVELKATQLPQDTVVCLRQDAMAWIKQYGITSEEITDNNICWSESKELLIFPFYDGKEALLAWQGRYFGSNPKYPKYVTYGVRQEVLRYIGCFSDPVVLVEDVVSAIKVGRVKTAFPLLSSDANKYQLYRIHRQFDNIVIWLDPDKKAHSIKLGQRAESFFKSVRIVFSDKDPKDYSTKEIESFLE